MREILKTLILDFQESSPESGIPRELEIQTVPKKATVCIGVRRGGKSTYMFQIIHNLIKNKVAKENILYLNFFDDRLHFLQHTDLSTIMDAYYSLYPEKKNSEKIYCFFDEIQVIQGWEPFIDRLLRSENCEVYITGSSAQLLSKEIATQMRGRALSWEMFPFSFSEYLTLKNIDWKGALSTKKQLLIQKAFLDYWETGGFPETIELPKSLRIKIHQDYFQTVLFRDLIERHDISHPKALTDLSYKLMDNISSLYSINKLTGFLQSLGHKAPKSTVASYMEWFEDCYFLFTVSLFDASLSRSKANPKKVYSIDHSLVRSVSSGILLNSGLLLENLVFLGLRRRFKKIYYFKTKSGKEVDFIIQNEDRTKSLVQVSETLENEKTKKREINALIEAAQELNLTEGLIVTRNTEEKIQIGKITISILPIWKFLITY